MAATKLKGPEPYIYPVEIDASTRLDPAKHPDPLTVTAAEQSDFHLAPAPQYRLPEDKLRRVRVVHIGAGVSGLTFTVLARWRLKNVELKIYEKNPELGGTWLEVGVPSRPPLSCPTLIFWPQNRYPGVRCDVPSNYYSFRFLSHDWTSGYATAKDIWDYCRLVGNVVGLDSLCEYNSEVLSATWDEPSATWKLEVKDGKTGQIKKDYCHYLINGNGPLNRPKMPDIPGIEKFKGPVLHTARWDPNFDPSGKRLASIGSGSSGLQLMSGLQPLCKHLDIYIRTPAYITDYSANLVLTDEERRQFKDKVFFRKYLADFWIGGEKRFNLFKPDSKLQARFKKIALDKMVQIKDPVLRAKLTPNYPVGCRRLTPSVDFFNTIQAPNVEAIVGDVIERITETGIVAEGKLREVDAICVATG